MIPLDSTFIRLAICFYLVIIGLWITLELALYALENENDNSSHDEFLDFDGNHTYYERSIIEKTRFHLQNPEVPIEDIRSITELFKSIIYPIISYFRFISSNKKSIKSNKEIYKSS